MMFRSLLCVAALLGMAAMARAEPVMYIGLEYQTSYNAVGYNVGPLETMTDVLGDGTTKTTVLLPGDAEIHAFKVLLNVSGLAAGEDALYFQYYGVLGGGATLDDGGLFGGSAYAPSDLSLVNINPPRMPTSSNPYSDAPSRSGWNLNEYCGCTPVFAHDVYTNMTSQTGNGNGQCGDYAADMNGSTTTAGMHGVGEGEPYHIGTIYLKAITDGTFGFSFRANPSYFQIITNNTGGLGVLANRTYPLYTGKGDSVQFQDFPEPGTLALLAGGLIGLMAYAWLKRR
jgi:hypothetical protein